MIEFYENLISKYPVISIEDGLAEEDWESWKKMTDKMNNPDCFRDEELADD